MKVRNYKFMKDAKIKDSYYDEMEDLKDRARSMFGGDYGDLDEIVAQTLDDGLIYDNTIFELAKHYLNGSDILNMFYEQLYEDLYSELSDEYEEDLEEREVKEAEQERLNDLLDDYNDDPENLNEDEIEELRNAGLIDSKPTKDVFINDPKKKIRK